MLLDLLGLEQPSALPAEEPPPRAPRSRSIAEDALPLAALLLSSVATLTDDLPPRALTSRAQVTQDAGPLGAVVIATLATFIDEERLLRAPVTPSLASDTFPEKPNQPAIAPFFSEEERAAHQPWLTVRASDAFPEHRLLAPFLDVDGATRGPWRPARLGLDTFPEKRVLGPHLADEGPFRGQWKSPRATDTFAEKRLLAPFLDEAGAIRVARQAIRLEDVGPIAPLDQNDVVAFLDDERPSAAPRGRAQAFDTFPEKRVLGPHLADDGPFKGPWRSARAADTFPEKRVLAPFLGEEHASARAWRTGYHAFDTLPEKRLLAPFLDEAGVLRVAIQTVRPEDVGPVTPLDQNDVVAFLDDERPPIPRRSSARAKDTFPEKKLLAPFLDETATFRVVQRAARAESDEPPALLDQNDVASFLDDETIRPVVPRQSISVEAEFVLVRVLPPLLDNELPRMQVGRTSNADTEYALAPILAPFLNDERTSGSGVLRGFLAEDLSVLTVLIPPLFPFIEDAGLPPRDPHPDAYTDDTGALGPMQGPDLATFFDTDSTTRTFRLRERPQDAWPEQPASTPSPPNGIRVRVKLVSAAFTGAFGFLQPQPPIFGRLTALSGSTAEVLTERGRVVRVGTSSLEEIQAASQLTLETWLDKIVVGRLTPVGPRFGDGYIGRVAGVFVVAGSIRVLIKLLTNGMYYEMPQDLVQLVKGR